jgi:chemotaxis signal transduction protein
VDCLIPAVMRSTSQDDDAVSHLSQRSRWVVFLCGGQRFGLPLEGVKEIIAPRQFTRLPGAAAPVCGLIGVRGRAVTVLDLGTMLGMRSAAALPDHRLLLLELVGRQVGVAVDEVTAILPAQLNRAAVSGYEGTDAILGTATIDGDRFIAIDPVRLTEDLLQQV